MVFVVHQGVAVAHHTRRRVIPGHGQGIAFRRDDRLREARRHATTDHADATHAQALQTVWGGDLEGALLGQGAGIGCATVLQVAFRYRQFAALHAEPIQRHRVVEVGHVQRQCRAAGIAVGVLDRVGETLQALATAAQALEVRVAGVQRVGVGTVCGQHQGAVSTSEGPGDYRATGHAVGALQVVAQYIAGQFGLLFGGGNRIAVIHGLGHIVTEGHIQAAGRSAAIDIRGDHLELFADAALSAGVVFVVHQGVAVAHHTRRRVIPGHGQGIAFRRDDRLREARRHATTDHADATHAQALQTVWGGDLEGALLGQGAGIGCATVLQVAFRYRQFAALHAEPIQRHRVVEVGHVQRQCRAAGIAVGVLDRVGETLQALATAAQALEVRVAGVQRVGVGTVCGQHQGAVSTSEGPGDYRATGHAVGALQVVAQYIAGQFGLLFGGGNRIAVIHGLGHIVTDDHVQRPLGNIAVAVADQYRQLFAL
ncbi:hypothetical protein D3C81_999930 [compost metagenome]